MLTFARATIAQDPPKPVLLDEFGPLPCEHILAHTDALAADLMREPGSEAIILIHKPVNHPEHASGRRKLIWSALQLRGVDSDRYSFYRSETSPDGDIRTQFWKLPLGAEAPVASFERWPDEAPDTTRAFVFGYVDESDICPTYVPKAFAKLILENPGSRGHIVVTIAKNHLVERFGFADGFIKNLVEQQGVPRKRLRLFFSQGESTEAEFWFVPAKKK
jgi:hypothetical protein